MHQGLSLPAVLWLLCGAAAAAEPTLHHCPDARLTVTTAATDDLRALVCEGGARALDVLTGLGLRAPEALQIEVVGGLPELYGARQLGTFDAAAGRIRVLGYAGCEGLAQGALLFGQPLGPDLYRSIVAHEVAHAVVSVNDDAPGPRLIVHEYIAYVTQLSAMGEPLRDGVLAASPVGAFGDVREMSVTRYLLDPQAFGIAAYRHFRGLRDPRTFLGAMLRGELRLPRGFDR